MKRLQRGFTLIELMIVVAIIGILAAIAIPNFIKFQARSKQSEAKANLKGLFTAEKAYYQEKDFFSTGTSFIGFTPERNNRYLYLTNAAPTNWEDRTTSTITPPAPGTTYDGIKVDEFKWKTGAYDPQALAVAAILNPPGCGGESLGLQTRTVGATTIALFVGEAVGNVDNDTQQDIWTINTESRTAGAACDETLGAPAGATLSVSGGQPANDTNDVNR